MEDVTDLGEERRALGAVGDVGLEARARGAIQLVLDEALELFLGRAWTRNHDRRLRLASVDVERASLL
jgi:hypothetical protein